LYAMAASCVRAQSMRQGPEGEGAVRMADVFCRASRLRIEELFNRLFDNEDESIYRLAQEVLRGEHAWLERGALQAVPDGADLAPPAGGARRDDPGERQLSGASEATQIGAG
jgi:hypothetical protein